MVSESSYPHAKITLKIHPSPDCFPPRAQAQSAPFLVGVWALAFPRNGEMRDGKRFTMTCPVTVVFQGKGRKTTEQQGRLHDIGIRGASFYAPTPLNEGTHVTLMIEFPNVRGQATTAQFDGLVTRARREAAYEIAVVFRRRGRFLRANVAELLARFSSGDEHKAPDPEASKSPKGFG
jgi:hypothetical protein